MHHRALALAIAVLWIGVLGFDLAVHEERTEAAHARVHVGVAIAAEKILQEFVRVGAEVAEADLTLQVRVEQGAYCGFFACVASGHSSSPERA